MTAPRLLFLPRYSANGASSRCRTFQLLPHLERQGFRCEVSPFFSTAYLEDKYRGQGRVSLTRHVVEAVRRRVLAATDMSLFDAVIVEKELLPYGPTWFERLLFRGARRIVLDFDDAVWIPYQKFRWLGNKIGRLMAGANAVVGGSDVLVVEARRHCRRVVKIPTAVDLDRYLAKEDVSGSPPVVGWIGTPVTSMFLPMIAPSLAALAREVPFRLLLVGARPDFRIEGVDVLHHSWSETSEVDDIRSMDVGIMPLPDSDFARGKCGYKLIQYMACGLPTVASAVGENKAIVTHGETGFLASSEGDWVASLRRLLESRDLRRRMGAAGRVRVHHEYGLEGAARRYGSLVSEVLREPSGRTGQDSRLSRGGGPPCAE